MPLYRHIGEIRKVGIFFVINPVYGEISSACHHLVSSDWQLVPKTWEAFKIRES